MRLPTINDAIVGTYDRSYKEYTLKGKDTDGNEKEITVHVGDNCKVRWTDELYRPHSINNDAIYAIEEILVTESGTVYFKFKRFVHLHDVSKLQIQEWR